MIINEKEIKGLTDQEVQAKKEAGQINVSSDKITKSIKQIIRDNTFTFFNFLNIVLLVLILLVQSYRNTLFIFIIVTNTIVGIYQEIKSKKILDQLSVLNGQDVEVIRNNELKTISIEELVTDDMMIVTTGTQIPADCILYEGHLEANESLLTGESVAVLKQKGDQLFSGSFITSGRGVCQVIHVGHDNYVNKITDEAKQHTRYYSQLRDSLDYILKIVSIIILPIGILLFSKQYFYSSNPLQESVVSTVAALLGMIPEGLYLLTSVALAVSVMRLAKKKTLVQELYCIETLARIDTLCLDKTGTLTKGTMVVEEDVSLNGESVEYIIGNMLNYLEDTNVTSTAMREKYSVLKDYEATYLIPFSSDRKYSAISFKGIGSYYLGAFQFVFPKGNTDLKKKIDEYTHQGYRVLVLAKSPKEVNENELLDDLIPMGLVVLSDVMRDHVYQTLQYFKEQGVTIKIISGDDPTTVSAIASRAGVDHYEKFVDASSIDNDHFNEVVENHYVFGRVTPQQKKQMIEALKENGHTVAMTGDGVNDVLAFKKSDCSIAMASGSDAAKNAANLVLLDNNFNAMPQIVNEGRRVINNITRSSSMFLIKTIFSALIAVATIIFGQAYPFKPIQLSLLSAFCVGIPTFFLTYESDFTQIKGHFFDQVLKNAFPYALTIAIASTLVMNIGLYYHLDRASLTTFCLLLTGWNYYLAILRLYTPLNRYRKLIIYTSQIVYYLCMIILHDLFYISFKEPLLILMIPIFTIFSHMLYEFNLNIYQRIKKINHLIKKRF